MSKSMSKTPLGRLDAGAFGTLEIPRLERSALDHSRNIGYPVWCSSVSPVTGKWRVRTVAVNRPVGIAGITVHPGDLVIADEVGVCFVPFARAAEVLAVAQRLARREDERLAKLASGMALKDWTKL